MNKTPFFSIILPTYNRANFIERAINSVLSQTFQNYELIVIDDGSTDNTSEVIGNFKDSRLGYFYKENEERNIARNFGIKKATGVFISFLDSDDYFFPSHLKAAFNLLQNSQRHWAYLGDLAWRNKTTVKLKRIRRYIIHENPFAINGVVVRRDLLKEIKFINSSIVLVSEDHYLWLRLAARYPIALSPDNTYKVHDHAERSLNNIDLKKLRAGTELLIDSLQSDKIFMNFYRYSLGLYFASKYTFIALVANEYKFKNLSLYMLLKAVYVDIRIITTKRFWASLKNALC